MGKKKNELEDAHGLNRLIEQLTAIDMSKVAVEREETGSPQEILVRKLREDKTTRRVLKGKGVPKKHARNRGKYHWKARQKRRREYHAEKVKPYRSRKKAELLSTKEGWWEYLTRKWAQRKVPVEITEQEWYDSVWTAIGDRLFTVRRYDANSPISLGNIYVVDVDNGAVLFDGKEFTLKELGYTL